MLLGNADAGQTQFRELRPNLPGEAALLHDGASARKRVRSLYPPGACLAQLGLVVSDVKVHSAPSAQNGLRNNVALDLIRSTVDGGLAHVEVGARQRCAMCSAHVIALPASLHRLLDK